MSGRCSTKRPIKKKVARALCFASTSSKTQRVGIVGAIVIGKCDLFYPARNSAKFAPVPLSGGRHGLIASGSHNSSGAQTDQRIEHGAILAEAPFEISAFQIVGFRIPGIRVADSGESQFQGGGSPQTCC